VRAKEFTEKIPPLKFYSGVTDSHSGQTNGVLWAYDPTKYKGGFDLKQVEGPGIYGYIEWVSYQGETQIQMIEVLSEFRRKSVGSQMVKALKDSTSDKVVWSGTTDDGEKLRKAVGEAPIGDVYVDNSIDDYTKPDAKLLRRPDHEERIRKAFSKTPFTIDLIFQPHSVLTKHKDTSTFGNDDPDGAAAKLAKLIKKQRGTTQFGPSELPKRKKGVITLQLGANMSDKSDWMPLTPWIIAHKLGHSIQDKTNDDGQFLYDEYEMIINTVSVLQPHHFTFKSARNDRKKSLDAFEFFPELMAEYLIKGKITLDTAEIDHTFERQEDAPSGKDIEKKINYMYKTLLQQCVGHAFIGV